MRRRRVLRKPSIIVIAAITGILGIAILIFVTEWIEENTASGSNPWERMNCIQLSVFEYAPEHEKLSEVEHSQFHKALEKCT